MKKYLIHIKKFESWYSSARQSEKVLIGIIAFIALCTLIYTPVSAFNSYRENNEIKIKKRVYDLEQLDSAVSRYQSLKLRFDKVRQSFEDSQMTLEQLTSELEQIVKNSLSNDNYELNTAGSPVQMGLDFERQQFILKVRSLSLEQLVKLLHQLEQGKSPLLLGKVDITKLAKDNEFSATLEIFSISKA